MKTFEIKILLWLFVSILITLSALGFAGTGPAAPLPAERTDEPLQAAHWPSAVETPPPPSLTIPSALPGSPADEARARATSRGTGTVRS